MKLCIHCGHEIKTKGRSRKCNVCRNGISRYNLNRLQQLELHKKQNGKCAICEDPIIMFESYRGGCVDHCHTSGKVRGLVCHSCNVTVGYIENKGVIESLRQYLTPS